jgi:hypothetical protein
LTTQSVNSCWVFLCVWASSTLVRSCRRETSQIRARERLCYLFFGGCCCSIAWSDFVRRPGVPNNVSNRPPPPLSCRVLFCAGKKGNKKKREGYIPTTSLYIFSSGNATSDTTEKTSLRLWTLNWRLAAAANSCDILPDVRCTSFHLAINRRLGRRRLAVPALFWLSSTR